jgi:hypothetical protein
MTNSTPAVCPYEGCNAELFDVPNTCARACPEHGDVAYLLGGKEKRWYVLVTDPAAVQERVNKLAARLARAIDEMSEANGGRRH